MQKFVTFIGANRTGHNLVAAILDTHIDVSISLERVNPMTAINSKYYHGIKGRNKLFKEIQENKRLDAGFYDYHIGLHQRNTERTPKIIGDSISGINHVMGINNNYDAFCNYIGVPILWVWVVRNPFDNIHSMHKLYKKGIQENLSVHLETIKITSKLYKKVKNDCLVIHIEDLIENPRNGLIKMFNFLSTSVNDNHLEVCSNFLYKNPIKRFSPDIWNKEQINKVKELINNTEILQCYKEKK
jgi:hypothetical protein